ncbi:Protein-tyrosine phosphatase-like protein [Naviculisporaceae sp. PSN 640]
MRIKKDEYMNFDREGTCLVSQSSKTPTVLFDHNILDLGVKQDRGVVFCQEYSPTKTPPSHSHQHKPNNHLHNNFYTRILPPKKQIAQLTTVTQAQVQNQPIPAPQLPPKPETMGSTTTPGGIPLPSPPFITTIPGLANLRDAGGYPISSSPSKIVRRGILYRSAEPSSVPPQAASLLVSPPSSGGLGITHIYDLRSLLELAKKPSHAAEWDANGQAKRVFVPVFLDKDYSPEAMALRFKNYGEGTGGFVLAYETILESAADGGNEFRPFGRILEHLAGEEVTPCLVHCTAGKDRTGLIVAIVLSLLGVEDEVIAHDYSLTDLGLAQRKEAIVQHLMETPGLFGDRARAETMVSSRKENMLETLKMIRTKYGSVEKYVVDHCKVSPETVERLRRNLTVEASEEEVLNWREHAELVARL